MLNLIQTELNKLTKYIEANKARESLALKAEQEVKSALTLNHLGNYIYKNKVLTKLECITLDSLPNQDKLIMLAKLDAKQLDINLKLDLEDEKQAYYENKQQEMERSRRAFRLAEHKEKRKALNAKMKEYKKQSNKIIEQEEILSIDPLEELRTEEENIVAKTVEPKLKLEDDIEQKIANILETHIIATTLNKANLVIEDYELTSKSAFSINLNDSLNAFSTSFSLDKTASHNVTPYKFNFKEAGLIKSTFDKRHLKHRTVSNNIVIHLNNPLISIENLHIHIHTT